MQHLVLSILIFSAFQLSSCSILSRRGLKKKSLITAVKKSNRQAVIASFSEDANSNELDEDGTPVLHWASAYDTEGTITDILLQKGADIDAKDKGRWTAFDWADLKKNSSAMQHLIQKAINLKKINTRCQNGKTLLHCAVELAPKESNKIVKQLLALSLDPNVKDNIGSTPLHYAAKNPNIDIAVVKMLVQAGARRDLKNHYGYIPLDYLSDSKKKDLMIELWSPGNPT